MFKWDITWHYPRFTIENWMKKHVWQSWVVVIFKESCGSRLILYNHFCRQQAEKLQLRPQSWSMDGSCCEGPSEWNLSRPHAASGWNRAGAAVGTERGAPSLVAACDLPLISMVRKWQNMGEHGGMNIHMYPYIYIILAANYYELLWCGTSRVPPVSISESVSPLWTAH